MRLPSARQRVRLYDQLRVYVESGTPIREAMISLAQSSPPRVRDLCQGAKDAIDSGQTFANALIIASPDLPKFEQAILHASELSGRLPIGCTILRDTMKRFLDLRTAALTACLYPVFMIHLAIIIGSVMPYIVEVMVEGTMNWKGYGRSVFLALLILHGVFWSFYFFFYALKKKIGSAVAVEKLLRMVPVIGKTWWSLVISRFAQAYDGMLNAGANVIDALEVSSLAANSAILRAKVQEILPHIKHGDQIGPLLQSNDVLGKPWEEFWVTGEKTGRQEEMLNQIVRESAQQAEQGFAVINAVVPKAIYIVALVIVAYQIIMGYAAYLQKALEIGDKI
jgi:type II secretory pathway component PulF